MDLELRKTYLGGSDAAGVLGLSRWDTPLSVWSEKTGQVEPKVLDSEAVQLGIELEDYVARRFARITGKKVQRKNETVFHKSFPFLGANLDRTVVGEDAILECKTAGAWKAKEWGGEEIPQEYIIQCLHYLAVTGKQTSYIAVLIGNQDFKWKRIDRDERTINDLVTKEVSFWREFVEPKIMPMTITSNDSMMLGELFEGSLPEDQIVSLSDDEARVIENIKALEADDRVVKAQIAQQGNVLKAILGEHVVGVVGRWKVTWKPQVTLRLDTDAIKEEEPNIYKKYAKESKTRVLRIKETKEEK